MINNKLNTLLAALFICQVEAVSANTNPLADTSTGDVGDVLEKAIPTLTLAATLIRKDYAGAKEFASGLAFTMGSTYLLKQVVNKERPDGRGDDSFPSAHTAVTMHSASFVHARYGFKRALPMYLAASWVGHSRIHDDRHDEEDVLVGAAIGYLAGRYFTTRYRGLEISPAFTDEFVGVQMSFRH